MWAVHQADVRTRQFRDTGLPATTALARAQSMTDRSVDCVTAKGSLDGGSYGAVLRPRGLVGLRGAGWSNDGLWYVQQVVHRRATAAATPPTSRSPARATAPPSRS